MKRERGFTLIELLIAITLLAALSTGILMAMRAGLLTLLKTGNRLEANRRVISVQQILQHELSDAMPVLGQCGTPGELAGPMPAFRGDAQTLHLVSSFSLTEGARGFPRALELQVLPADEGVRLIVNEALFAAPVIPLQFCEGGVYGLGHATSQSFVLADHLAYCRFVYKDTRPDSPKGGGWLDKWEKPDLPYAVRVEMAPLRADLANLPLLTVTARIPVTRFVLQPYYDYW